MFVTPEVWQLECPALRVLELFAGIGGLAAAWPEATVVAAVDINQQAARVYRQNFSHAYHVREIESLCPQSLQAFSADCWWMSPPCQPFTRRGAGRDLADPRCRGFAHLVETLAHCRPRALGLENVIGFAGSQAQRLLLEELKLLGYRCQSLELCPSQLGWPNRRPRFYMLASLTPMSAWRDLPQLSCRLSELVDSEIVPGSSPALELLLPAALQRQYFEALDRVELNDSTTACFAGSYGKTILKSGSYLRCGSGYRRFSPREVARLLGFTDAFRLDGLTNRSAWKLLGNGLSLPCVRYVLSHLRS